MKEKHESGQDPAKALEQQEMPKEKPSESVTEYKSPITYGYCSDEQ
jgi:hypothetical protein